ncbi:elongation factor Ts [Candidatus Nomurabacteria bacterium]|nr:elongation factor Ts [Candidatus Nomurabacteria bacterium]
MSLELIKKIRQITGAGMVDVKKALDEADGNEEKAIEILRKAGSKIAAKKADREASEGVLAIVKKDNKVAVVGLNCETDFVARNEDFISSVNVFAEKLLELGKENFAAWAEDEIKNNLIVKIGENLRLAPDFEILSGEIIGDYLHSNNKVAGVVVLKGGSVDLAKDIAMHIAAMAPKYLKPEDVPEDVLAKEKEIYAEQLKAEGKPEAMLEQILQGKLQKFYTEVCLLKQMFIKDDKKNIEQLLTENNAELESFVYRSL